MGKYVDAFEYRLKFDAVIKALHDIVEALKAFNSLPAVNGQEVRRGRWEEDFLIGDGVYRCTVCDEKFVTLEGSPDDNRFFYCPFCGAKMDEEALKR